jgi:hypothetical protein
MELTSKGIGKRIGFENNMDSGLCTTKYSNRNRS